MHKVHTAVAGLIAMALAADVSSNFLVLGDDTPATQPTTQPMQVSAAPAPATSQPVLVGGPTLSNQYASPTASAAQKPQMTSVDSPLGADSNKPVATVQIGVGVGPAVGPSVPNTAVPVPGPDAQVPNGVVGPGNPTTAPIAPATANPVHRR